MEFRRNLEEIRQERRSEPTGALDHEWAKRRINEVLFEILPSNTTLQEMEDLALAIVLTVQGAWEKRRSDLTAANAAGADGRTLVGVHYKHNPAACDDGPPGPGISRP